MNIRLLKKIDGLAGALAATLIPSPAKHPFPRTLQNVLFIRPGGLGDALLLIPAIRAVEQAFPAAAIDVLCETRNASAFTFCRGIRTVFRYDHPREFLSLFARRYDIVIDTEQWYYLSAVVARLIRSSWKIGYATNLRRRLFTHALAYSQEDYEAESFLNLLRPLGIDGRFDHDAPFLEVPGDAAERALRMLGEFSQQRFVAVFPGATIPERRWGGERFRALALRLREEGVGVVVIGGRVDAAEAEAIAAGGAALNLAGKTSLAETAVLIGRSALLVSGDSGILHLGVGLGKPTLSLFGPGIEKKWAPRGRMHQVLNHRLSCSPCTIFGNTPPCPRGAPCISGITVEEVSAAVTDLLGVAVPA